MKRREISGEVFSAGFLTVGRVGESYSFHSLASEPAAILTRLQTQALCSALLTDMARGGAHILVSELVQA
jgi:hypothetical protein